MSENSGSKETKSIGQIQIADEVLAIIAGTAALETEGVAGMAGHIPGDIAQAFGVKNLAKGVKVDVKDGNVTININLVVKFSNKIQSVSEEVQKRVKNAVETMTGMNASEINVSVTGVQKEKS